MQPREIWRHKDNDREIVITEIFDGEVKYEFLDNREPYELPIDEFPNWFELVEDEPQPKHSCGMGEACTHLL